MTVDAATHLVRVHINEEAFESPNPTTGEALYSLGSVRENERLYRDVDDDREDKPVRRKAEHIHLNEDEHFHSQKVFEVFVNSYEHEIEQKHITYTQVIELYLGSGGKPSNEYLVKYSHGPATNPSGTLAPGQKVKVKDGMRFRVAGTGES